MPFHSFEQALARGWPPADWRDVHVLVAVSGGPDSVSLLRAMCAIRARGTGRLFVGHFQHGLRPEADRDEEFVRRLAAGLGLECDVGRGLVRPGRGEGIEAAARRARYGFFRQSAQRIGARFVALAHTADDQAETILLRVLRGTGVAGLRGMPRIRKLSEAVSVIRPLLSVRRAAVRGYLADLGQPFCEDATNLDTTFMRNRLRAELLPLITSRFNPQAVDALLRLGRSAAAAQHVIDALVDDLFERAVRPAAADAAPVEVDCRLLSGESRHLVRELFVRIWQDQRWPLRGMAYRHFDLLADMARPTGGAVDKAAAAKRVFPGNVAARRDGNSLRLKRGP
ncbi:MAG: tRNA lysidine(34) synthetase TilS [Planctomycetia bacterium]|nr:tRNA lysidine(34) synthetase TilS [Planctomycetia bacterium]